MSDLVENPEYRFSYNEAHIETNQSVLLNLLGRNYLIGQVFLHGGSCMNVLTGILVLSAYTLYVSRRKTNHLYLIANFNIFI